MVTGIVVSVGAVVALLVLLVVRQIGVQSRREKGRQEALEQWARAHGWQIVRRPEFEWVRRVPGRNQRGVSLAVSGTLQGRPATIAEYSYRSNEETHRYVLLLVRLDHDHPAMAVYRRSSLSKLGRTLFGDTPTAVGNEPFDREYRVTGVVTAALVNEHVAADLPPWSLEGRELLTYRVGRIDDPATIPAELEPLLRVADLIEPRD